MYGADTACHSPAEDARCARQFFLLEALKLAADVPSAISMAEQMRRYVEDGEGSVADGEKAAEPLRMMLAGLPRETLAAAERDAAARERREERYAVLSARSVEDPQF